jgi:hypothetical protein
LFSPLTAATDEGKILVSVSDPGALNGSVSDFNDTGDAVDGNAVLVQCPPGNTAVSVNENNGYVFDGAVGATANWIQFTGAGTLNAGAGLLLSGSTLDVQAADNSMTINADDIQVNVGDGLVVGTALDVDPYSGGDASVAPAFVDGDGVGVDTDGSTITHTAGVLGVPAGGIGATELDETDTYDFSPSGSVAVATAAPSTNTTQAASTAFVQQEIGSFQNVVFGCIRLAIVVAASNTNVNIASAPATIDGVTIGAGAKVLLLNQTTPSENGVWESAGTGNPFTRPNKEFPTGSNQGGAYVRVIDGATFDDLTYRCTNDPGSDVVDIDNLNFSIATSLTAGNGITFGGSLGNEVTVAADATGGANLARAINVSANGVAISIDGSSVTENGSQQLAAPVPSGQGLNQAPGNSAGADDFDTGLSLAQTPANGHLPRVYLNGAYQQVARNDGERAASAWYFGAVGGTAIADGSIASTHKLFYNAAVTGVDITGSDRIDIDYVIPRP